MLGLRLLVVAASVWAPLAELATASVTLYSTKAGKTPIATSAAYAAVATLAAYDQTVLNAPAPPNPAITNNFVVQVSLELWIARNSSRPLIEVVCWGNVGSFHQVGILCFVKEKTLKIFHRQSGSFMGFSVELSVAQVTCESPVPPQIHTTILTFHQWAKTPRVGSTARNTST
jgi:hypothetical protein